MAGKREATIEDLYGVKGKAEIVGDELVLMTPTGGLHGYAVTEIAASLREYGRRIKRGYAFADNVGFIVTLPNRRSLSGHGSDETDDLPTRRSRRSGSRASRHGVPAPMPGISPCLLVSVQFLRS